MKKYGFYQAVSASVMAFSLTAFGAFASCPHCQGHATVEDESAQIVTASSSVIEELDEGKRMGLELFPSQNERYKFSYFLKTFYPLVAEPLKEDFYTAWELIMEAEESVPHLSIVAEIRHIQCLYGKLWNAHNKQEEEWIATQKKDIYAALNHTTHMTLIKDGNPDIADKINLFFHDIFPRKENGSRYTFQEFSGKITPLLKGEQLQNDFTTGFQAIFSQGQDRRAEGTIECARMTEFYHDLSGKSKTEQRKILFFSFSAPQSQEVLEVHAKGLYDRVVAYNIKNDCL